MMNNITIGGKAGDGIKAAGQLISKVLGDYGYNVFILDDYPSLITGGHNFNKITFSEEKVYSYYKQTDILVALNKDTIEKHTDELSKGGIILFDSNKITDFKEGIGIPAQDFVKEVEGIPIMRNSVLLGALCRALGVELEKLNNEFIKKYSDEKAKKNIELAKKGYGYVQDKIKPEKGLEKVGESKNLFTGNQLIARGSVKAGLDNYIAYPMTPASSILHYLAENKNKFEIKTVHPENEIGAVNMAIGSAFAGAKTMTGTSGGGFALMTEALSLAGISEVPLLFIESQRTGPSTGVPTYTAQADLDFVLTAGHGEFPRIVLAPGTHEQAFYLTAEALNLAWQFQVPVILLSDKHLSESWSTVSLDESKVKPFEVKATTGDKRYKQTEDGISPFIFPGVANSMVKGTSYEHDERGITVEDPQAVVDMQNKRLRKMKTMKKEMRGVETVKVYGEGKNVVVTWGSTIGAVLEATKGLEDVKVVQVLYMKPFPVEKFLNEVKESEKICCVEANVTGQLANLIKAQTGVAAEKILKYDSRQFEPLQLKDYLGRWLA